ncbi:MAG: hypothetical protein HZB65_02045 [Candidatus Aenigmarchaeota archaeon]|nr:hypothetical protein [Candidatus Aenigmarchaeota archaeon]
MQYSKSTQIATGVLLAGMAVETVAGFLGLPSYADDSKTAAGKPKPRATKQRIGRQQQTLIDELYRQLDANKINRELYKIEPDYKLGDEQIADVALIINGEPIRAYDISGIGYHVNNRTGGYSFRSVDKINSAVPIGFPEKPKNYKGSNYEWYVSEGVRKDIGEIMKLVRNANAPIPTPVTESASPRPSPTPEHPTPSQTPAPSPTQTQSPSLESTPINTTTPSYTPSPSPDLNVIEEMKTLLKQYGASNVLINEPVNHVRYCGMNGIVDVLAIIPENDDVHIALEFNDNIALGNGKYFFSDVPYEQQLFNLMNNNVFKSDRGCPAKFSVKY